MTDSIKILDYRVLWFYLKFKDLWYILFNIMVWEWTIFRLFLAIYIVYK